MTARTLRWVRNEYGDRNLLNVRRSYWQGLGYVEKFANIWRWSDGRLQGYAMTMFGAMSQLLRALGER